MDEERREAEEIKEKVAKDEAAVAARQEQVWKRMSKGTLDSDRNFVIVSTMCISSTQAHVPLRPS